MPMVGVDAEVGANIKMNTISRVVKYNVEEGKGTKLTQEILFGVATPLTCPVLCATKLFKMGLFCGPCLESLVVFVTIVCLVAKPHNDVVANVTVHGLRAA